MALVGPPTHLSPPGCLEDLRGVALSELSKVAYQEEYKAEAQEYLMMSGTFALVCASGQSRPPGLNVRPYV
jgi:hypothetical protein